MKKKSFILVLGLLFTKVFGIFRELALGNLYGPGAIADAYLIASNIPNVIFGFVAAGMVTTFIPIFSRINTLKGEEHAKRFMSNALNILGALSLVLAIFGFVFADPLVRIFATFNDSTQALAVSFVRISIFSVLFLAIKSILEGYLQIKQMFNIIPLNGFIMNMVIISSIILSYVLKLPIIMAGGILLATLAQTIVAIYYSRKKGYQHEIVVDLKDEHIGDMVKMAAPIILGSSIDQINKIIDTSIASGIMEGGVSTLNFAVKISDSILGIFVGAIATVMYPSLSKQAAEGKMEELKSTMNSVMVTINILIVPATVGLMVLATPVIEILYGRKFTPAQIELTSNALFWYTLGTVAFGIRQILVRTFYALHDSITPVISGFVSVTINIILNIILSRYMGLAGLALATSIAAMFSVVFLYVALRLKIGEMHTRLFLTSSFKIVIASLLMGTVVLIIHRYIGGMIGFISSIGLGVLTYAIVLYFMKINETDEIFNMVRRKLVRK